MNHLSDEQLAEWLAGEADQPTEAHLQSCAHCHTEACALRDGISRYTLTVRQQAESAQKAQLAANFAPRKALALHRLRWVGAGVLAMLLAGQTAWMLNPHRAPAASQPTASTPVNLPTVVSNNRGGEISKEPLKASNQMSDDELLEAVNNDLNRDVPQALAPVSAITVARNKIAAASGVTGNADLQGEEEQ